MKSYVSEGLTRRDVENLVINCIRILSVDAVQHANSGHPGTPMALAPVAFTLWDKFLRFNPSNPEWPNRDRFILSAGHASMLLYSLLHITGFDVSLDDIKTFRRLGSKCAGHPEYGLTPGVETTTGPLGQGASTSVGMAIAEKWLSSYFNKPGYEIIGYRVFSILSDGDIMEGITSEAASLAGHLGLDNLIWIYDDNKITIEGSTDLSFSEDVSSRFKSYGWSVQRVEDANDVGAMGEALKKAIESKVPSLIIVRSHIAYGSPNKQDAPEAHGSPLGEEEIRLIKKFYGWDSEKKFYIPPEVEKYREEIKRKGKELEEKWRSEFEKYKSEYPELAKEFEQIQKRTVPDGSLDNLPVFPEDNKGIATRSANGKILNAIAKRIPWFLGGAADVGPSTKTYIEGVDSFLKGKYHGRNFHYGIREHAMAAISNGLSLSKLRPYCSTYLVFSDYLKPSLRLSSLMRIPVIYVFTHDSIGLGEDGPTHQPVEQLPSLRSIPNLDVIRPADANELSVLWKYVMEVKDRPVAFILTRQNVPVIDRNRYAPAEGAIKGGYVVADCEGEPELILIASGSEVHPCIDTYNMLISEGVKVRVVSLPCWSLFDSQPREYKEKILPSSVKKRLSVEAASPLGWEKYVGNTEYGLAFGLNRFGESAPYQDLMKEFGFTKENIYRLSKDLLRR